MSLNEFEHNVLSDLALLKERTSDYPELRGDVAEIKGRIRLLEFKAGLAGTAAGAVVAGVVTWAKAVFGKG